MDSSPNIFWTNRLLVYSIKSIKFPEPISSPTPTNTQFYQSTWRKPATIGFIFLLPFFFFFCVSHGSQSSFTLINPDICFWEIKTSLQVTDYNSLTKCKKTLEIETIVWSLCKKTIYTWHGNSRQDLFCQLALMFTFYLMTPFRTDCPFSAVVKLGLNIK